MTLTLTAALLAGCEISPPSPTGPTTTRTLTSVTIGGSTGAATAGQTLALVATAIYSDNSTSNVTTQAAWTSSNPAVALVAPTGTVNFLTAGGVEIRAAFGGASGSLTVAVAAAPPTLTGVVVSGIGSTTAVGQTVALVATATYSNGTTANVTTQAAWTSSNPAVATVSSTGTATFIAVGSVDLRATLNAVTGEKRVAVSAATPPVTSLSVTGVGNTVVVGDTAALVATARYSDGSTANVTSQASWNSTNPGVATVSADGSTRFVNTGVTDLRATFGGLSDTVRVTVTAVPQRLTGVVTDAVSNQPAAKIQVLALGGPNEGRKTETDANGVYTLADLVPGSFTVQYSSSQGEYAATTRSVTVAQDTRLDVSLTPTFDVFYGTFSIALQVTNQTCDSPVFPGATGTIELAGQSDGSNFSVRVTERGVSRTYEGGRMMADGAFSGILPPGTLLPGFSQGVVPTHSVGGTISGGVNGRSLDAVESLTFQDPCPGKVIVIRLTGSR